MWTRYSQFFLVSVVVEFCFILFLHFPSCERPRTLQIARVLPKETLLDPIYFTQLTAKWSPQIGKDLILRILIGNISHTWIFKLSNMVIWDARDDCIFCTTRCTFPQKIGGGKSYGGNAIWAEAWVQVRRAYFNHLTSAVFRSL